MSVKAMSWVWERSQSVGSDLIVLLKIADRANDEGRDAWPSVATLVRQTRLSKSTVLRCIERLEAAGELAVERPGGGRSNRYELTFQAGDFSRCQGEDEPQAQPLERCQDDTSVNLTPVSPVKPEMVSMVTPNTSCTSSTHTPRASGPELPEPKAKARMPIIARGESLAYDQQQTRAHRGCHPEVCSWRSPAVRTCMPTFLVDEFARKLFGVAPGAAIADVIEWARADAPPAGHVASGDTLAYWRERWSLTRASPSGRVASHAPPGGGEVVPDAAATRELIRRLAGGAS